MRKDLQRRLEIIAAVLDRTTALNKLADGADKNFWQKFFYKEPKVAPQGKIDQAEPAPNPKTMVAPEAPRGNEQVAPEAKPPKPVQEPGAAPVKSIADFLHGGPIPLEVINPLAQLAKSLAGAGAIADNDIKSVVAFLAKMLRKYVGGQRLAQVDITASASRKARVAAREIDAELSENHKVSIAGGCYELQAGGDPENGASWERASGPLSGLYRGTVKIEDVPCVMFADAEGNTYAAPRHDACIEEPSAEPVKASYKAQISAVLASKIRTAADSIDTVKTILSNVPEDRRREVMTSMLSMLYRSGATWDSLGQDVQKLISPYVPDNMKQSAL